MSWQQLLRSHRVQTHVTSHRELEGLRAVVERDLKDARVGHLASYFDTCRRKRNILDYDNAQVVTETEAKELLQKADEFHTLIEQWIAHHHPQFSPQRP